MLVTSFGHIEMNFLAARSLTEVLVSMFTNTCVFLITLAIYGLLLCIVVAAIWVVSTKLYANFIEHPLHAVIFGVVVSCFICWFYLK